MKTNMLRYLGLSLVMVTAALAVDAQRQGPPVGNEPVSASWCVAPGRRCLFGFAGGCQVSCVHPGQPVCEGASCFIGFPTAALCYCESGGVS